MAKANSLGKGDFIEINNEPLQVIEREFVKPGKGGAFLRLKLRSCISGAVRKETYASEIDISQAEIIKRPIQFLYVEGQTYHCMDSENFEQFTISIERIAKKGKFLREGKEYVLLEWRNQYIDLDP